MTVKALLLAGKILAIGVPLLLVAVGVFFFSACSQEAVEQTTGPVSRDQALKHCPIELPSSAHSIQYASLAGGLQDSEQYVRFEAPVSECYSIAETIYTKWKRHGTQGSTPQFHPVNHPPSEKSHRLRTSWFDTERITKGVVAGKGTDLEPRIWIDEERGIFYYYYMD